MAVDRSHVMGALLALFGLAALIGLVVMLRWESRAYSRRGQVRAWRIMRLGAIPIAVATVAVVVLPARGVRGMEGLGVFYLLLFTAAPLVWFGLHWLLGRVTRPALGFADSFQLAATLPAFVIAVLVVAQQLQPLALSIAAGAQRAGYGMADEAPPPHALATTRRYATPAGDVLVARWEAAPEVQVERIDLLSRDAVIEDAGRRYLHRICQAPGTIALLWPMSEPAPELRVYWRAGGAGLRRSTLTPATPGDAVPFVVAWQGDSGFSLPEALPRQIVWLARATRDGRRFVSTAAQHYEPGEIPEMNCLPQPWQGSEPIAGVRLRIDDRQGEPIWLEALRPELEDGPDQGF